LLHEKDKVQSLSKYDLKTGGDAYW